MNTKKNKFRAWDKETNEMKDGDDLVLNHIFLLPNGLGLIDRNLNVLENYIIMQYVKNLNDEELYEGDIVEFYGPESDEKTISVIRFLEPSDASDSFGWTFGNFVKLNGFWIELDLPENTVKLGNIFENPELKLKYNL